MKKIMSYSLSSKPCINLLYITGCNPAAKLDKAVKELARRMDEIDTVENMKEGEKEAQLNTMMAWSSEQRERDNRKNHLVIHGLAEPADNISEGKDCAKADLNKLEELVEMIDAGIGVGNIKFCKRLGAKRADRDRPLLLGLKDLSSKEKLLEKAPKLADMRAPWQDINIVMDLTKMQR